MAGIYLVLGLRACDLNSLVHSVQDDITSFRTEKEEEAAII